jgi:hypothetical protein
MTAIRNILILLISFCLISCGGGGGGSDPNEPATEPAFTNLVVQPTALDAGDKINITIYLQEINKDGIVVKIRVPSSVLYFNDTGFLNVDGNQQNIDPEFYQSANNFNYLVYVLSRDQFGESNEGTVTVQFQASAAVAAGAVAVDVDFKDTSLSNAEQFDIDNPRFSAQDTVDIVVTNS